MSQVKLILSLDKDKLARVIDLILPFAHSFSVHRPLSPEPQATATPVSVETRPPAVPKPRRPRPERRVAPEDTSIGWILVKEIWKGPARFMDLKSALAAQGYSPESVGKYLRKLQDQGTVVDILEDGYKKYIIHAAARGSLKARFPSDLL